MAFRKVFGLVGAAALFSGMAFGQSPVTCAAPTSSFGYIAAEGVNELIPQLSVICTNTTATGGTMGLTISLNPTAAIVNPLNAGSTTLTSAVATTGGVNAFGTVGSSGVTFTVAIPAAAGPFTILINNIRINASQIPLSAGAPTPVAAGLTATGSISTTPASPIFSYTAPGTNYVAVVQNGLNPVKFYSEAALTNSGKVNFAAFGSAVSATSTYSTCVAVNNSSTTTAVNNTFVLVSEGFQSSFKTKADIANATAPAGTESTISNGTRIAVVIGNVAPGISVYMPLTVAAATGAGTLTMTASETGAYSAVTAVGGTGQFAAYGAVPVVNSTATAIYEVTADSLATLDTFNVPVSFNIPNNKVAAVPAPPAVTVSTRFAPINTTTIPSYTVLASSTSTLNLFSIAPCTTTLFFPFVTNQSGFDTGLVIDNTTGDPFGSVAAQAGACKLWFYGTGGTNPTAGPAPNPNEGGTASYNASESYAFTLGSALASASAANPATFSGYMLAQCQFQNAHGFAYITYNFPGTSSDTMGYLAVVIPRGSTAPESSGN